MIRSEAMDWLGEAEADLMHAEDCLKLKRYNWACFAAQQSAEKALKVLIMVLAKKRPSHVRDLTKLYAEVGDRITLSEEVVENLGELSPYYTLARYPNAGLTRPSLGISKSQAEKAISISRKLLEGVEDAIKCFEKG